MTGTQPPQLPRSQAGTSSQHLLTTLLGDYWVLRDEHLPSAALVALLGEFDIGLTAARAALNRLARRGVVVSSKVGRNSYYGLAPGASDMLLARGYRFISFGQENESWDGRWTVAMFSLSERERDSRYSVYSRLRWLGFAPLYDGTWVSARPVAEQARQEFDELGLREVTIFRATEHPPSARRAIDAWDLDEIAARYHEFITTYGRLRTQVRDGDVGASQALLSRTHIMDSWRSFPGIDPDLPSNLLPAKWPRREAYEIFVEVYNTLGSLAAIRVRQIVERYSPELAELVTYNTTEDLLDLSRKALERRMAQHAAEGGGTTLDLDATA
ncbi:PaaX family transcriptional regulator [Amycolatopsis sacchari]|uniref:Phenylacetic acid degradation operon negative regulatory protein n=1 Tax=Amycolatopsis sacchari TaxID=115433 RepID=A0A1I3UJ74_9PSEU|nr:PaaX family transcriptional regulator C-terminal domain-containing protein [Amycolatopsis sacchari]SFJ83568.1 phenylacetic acid degradation operon negative regulatory protein [Amycolatopsis sacchari]